MRLQQCVWVTVLDSLWTTTDLYAAYRYNISCLGYVENTCSQDKFIGSFSLFIGFIDNMKCKYLTLYSCFIVRLTMQVKTRKRLKWIQPNQVYSCFNPSILLVNSSVCYLVVMLLSPNRASNRDEEQVDNESCGNTLTSDQTEIFI